MKLSFRSRGLGSFDATAIAVETNELTKNHNLRNQDVDVDTLDLSYNKLTIFAGGRALKKLRVLDLSHNFLRGALNFPSSLTWLNIADNRISNFSGLDSLTQLRHLDASNNEIVSPSNLPASLQTLVLSNNQIESCLLLGHLHQLLKLHVDGNNIRKLEDLACLGGLNNLRHLYIANNPVCDNPKYFSVLVGCVRKLSTLDGATLSQAQANRMVQAQALQESRRRKERISSVASALRSSQPSTAAASEADDVLWRELRGMEARVKELERISGECYESERRERRRNALLQQQHKQVDNIIAAQERQVQECRDEIQRAESTIGHLERTLGSLEGSFRFQHAALVSKRLES